MNEYINKPVRVKDKDCLTYGKEAEIIAYHESIDKFEVRFSSQYVGYYNVTQLELILR